MSQMSIYIQYRIFKYSQPIFVLKQDFIVFLVQSFSFQYFLREIQGSFSNEEQFKPLY